MHSFIVKITAGREERERADIVASDGLTGTAGAASVQKMMIIRTLANEKFKFRTPVGKRRRDKKEREESFRKSVGIDEKRFSSLGTGFNLRI